MKKLLITLATIFFLTSPVMAHSRATGYTLEHGKSYTDHIISCSTKQDVMKHIRDITQLHELREDIVIATIVDNNCVPQKQYYTYVTEEYVCSFSLNDNNYTLLNTSIKGIEQFIVVHGLASTIIKHCI